MTVDRCAKIMMTVFILALFLNGVNPWIHPPKAVAKENTEISGNNKNADCSSSGNSSENSLQDVKGVERLLRYIESSVNDIQLTVKGIDRKIDALPSFKSADRG
ncbi:MAG: hypothetical protein NPINA01_13390 [Nitrospinaceae bacterium]|nr:MAG: hypothetical protein NPINA01_13390 [Nitrospinaceae bacterium]